MSEGNRKAAPMLGNVRTCVFATLALVLAACSTSSSSGGSSSGGSSSGGSSSGGSSSGGSSSGGGAGSCGLSFFPPDFPSNCQPAADAVCCDEEKACAANADCTALVECINACPAPRQDDCVNACAKGSDNPPGYAELDAIATCSKTKGWDAGPECNWPD